MIRDENFPVSDTRNRLATIVRPTQTSEPIAQASSTPQSDSVMPLSMPIWVRSGPAWSIDASTITRKIEIVSMCRCAPSILRSVTPVSRSR